MNKKSWPYSFAESFWRFMHISRQHMDFWISYDNIVICCEKFVKANERPKVWTNIGSQSKMFDFQYGANVGVRILSIMRPSANIGLRFSQYSISLSKSTSIFYWHIITTIFLKSTVIFNWFYKILISIYFNLFSVHIYI